MTESDLKTGDKIKSYGCIGLFFLPFVLVGIGTLFYSLFNIYNSQKTQDWTRVIADVQNVKLDYHDDNDGGGTYVVNINYKYIINNKKYSGNRIAFGYGGNDTDDHSSLFSRLENAKRIVVFVDPNDGSEAGMIKGLNNSIIGLLIFSIMWNSLLSIFIIPLFIKKETNINLKNLLFIIVIIWIVGISLLVSHSLNFSFGEKIEVIESNRKDTNEEVY